ncbi:hypothetical protein CC86DRAFT_161554 [Ophiobolus disseminans]|uniref:Uncharacterized protein n=1 Tax=Ophiobolus disseminans TaxID=1469910 RepID=A0A6A7ACN9_9PLEO|nr:hypothetical protein CC86DRAFT_161554 [Ophiobolus disseminans]
MMVFLIIFSFGRWVSDMGVDRCCWMVLLWCAHRIDRAFGDGLVRYILGALRNTRGTSIYGWEFSSATAQHSEHGNSQGSFVNIYYEILARDRLIYCPIHRVLRSMIMTDELHWCNIRLVFWTGDVDIFKRTIQ